MLDRRFIRENPDAVREVAQLKGIQLDVDELLRLDALVRTKQGEFNDAQRERRKITEEFKRADESRRAQLKEESAELDKRQKNIREDLEDASARLEELMLITPTIPWSGAPVGLDESANKVIKVWGSKPEFDFDPLDHVGLGEKRGWVEFARGRKISGERGYALAGDMVLLERAIHSYAIELLVQQQFRIISAPALVKERPLIGSGFFPLIRKRYMHFLVMDSTLQERLKSVWWAFMRARLCCRATYRCCTREYRLAIDARSVAPVETSVVCCGSTSSRR
jgi:seryl-tRNA synthetase